MKLFKYEGYKIIIEPEALLLKPIQRLWNRDRSINKDKAMADLGFVYFYCDVRSDYSFLTDDDDRRDAIIAGEGLGSKWKIDKDIQNCIDFYNSFLTTSELLLRDTRKTIELVRNNLSVIDFTEEDGKGNRIHTHQSVLKAAKEAISLVKLLDEVERDIKIEKQEEGRMRGQGEKTIFEDDLNS